MEPISAAVMAALGLASAGISRALAEGDFARARQLQEQALAEYGPDILPHLERLTAQQSQGSEFGNIQEDPRLRTSQINTLRELEGIYQNEGMTPADEAAMRLAQNQVAQRAGSDYASINQMLARRGQMGGGERAAALYSQAGQTAANTLGQMANESQIAARQRALQALEAGGSLAGNIRGDDYRLASDRARAQDYINQFNARQRSESDRFNAGQQQQEFENMMGVKGARNAARMGLAQSYMQGGQRTLQTGQGVGDAFMSAGAGMGDYYAKKKG